MRARFLCLLLLLAQPLQGEENPLTLAQSIDRALEANPAVLSSQEATVASSEREAAAFRALFPQLTAELSGRESTTNSADDYTATVSVSQPIFRGGRLYRGWKLAEATEAQARLHLERQQQFIRRAVKQAWYRLVAANDLAAESQDSLDRLRKLEHHARQFFNEGMVWQSDVLEAEVNVAQGEQEVFSATRRIYQAMAELNTLLRRPLRALLGVDREQEMELLPWDREEAFSLALQNRVDLERSRLEVEKREDRVRIARAGYYPDVTGRAEWSSTSAGFSRKSAVEGALVEVTVTQNVWDWGKVGHEVRAARSDRRQSERQLDQVTDQILLEVESAWLAVEEAEKRAKVLREALEKGLENYDVNTTRYQEQIGSARDVLEAQELLTRTRKDYINAVSTYQSALASLEFAVGVEL